MSAHGPFAGTNGNPHIFGKRPRNISYCKDGSLYTQMNPQLTLNTPALFSAMSYGSISKNAQSKPLRWERTPFILALPRVGIGAPSLPELPHGKL